MSIGITPSPQQTTTPLDFSALSGKSPQPNTFGEQNTQQAIDPSALLFGSDKQKDVNFGTPDSTVQNPQDASKTNDSQSNIAKLISALIMSLLQMLTNSNKKQDANQEQPDSQAPFQNNGGLGTPSADSGGGGTPDATGGGGGDTPSATGGGGGGGGDTPTATGGGGGGGGTPTATSGGGSSTPTATGDGEAGVTPQITPQLANPGRTSGTGSVSDTAGSTEQAGKINVVRDTIKVGAGEVFDGHGATFTADKSMGNGDQEENQKPMFELAEGATLKNVNLGENEVDGIHVKAKNAQEVTIDNVHAQNVGEDMITVKGEGGAAVTNLNIKNSSAKGADDKVVQLNADTHLKIDNFKADDFGTMVRTNGGKQFDDMSIELNGIEANHGKFALVKSDSDDLKLATGNIAMTDVKHAYDKTQASTQHTEL
ncbi:type III helper protein HrpW1 [Pseudomonas syringae pv. actinidiae ICMP 19071]|uniref:pectate lyase n=2 Tax=Pseudomonas syringae TaxID=317 RepID=UPI00035732A9|nr:pectate lyase [Pseudomonas syringae]EPM54072.1 type III helper protein HrpW1 [Pseudomonas syringae pv. actinidiae ICMP 19071]EPM64437.1 type III helper protein HrpW1 [Pseudomonas syringae pv. actinidiae ICMP 19073]EPM74443.1 type III helper protein HrpW1 [Pseudomonas syringae pv. actinidiae ICMP 19072]OSN62903.1 Pectate lyase A [Pseudomonas syringae pv. actinidiae]OSN72567.1 Pectate lyase A [Pseudomonas syringae pv. actinidiae]